MVGAEQGADLWATAERDRFAVWTVNRAATGLTVTLEMPELAGQKVSAELEYVTAKNGAANDYERADTVLPQRAQRALSFDGDGTATYEIPALSVAALRMRIAKP